MSRVTRIAESPEAATQILNSSPEGFKHLKLLEYLNLSTTFSDTQTNFFEALRKNTSITHLDIAFLFDDTKDCAEPINSKKNIKELVAALCNNQGLKKLTLVVEDLNLQEFAILREQLPKIFSHSQLTALSITINDIYHDASNKGFLFFDQNSLIALQENQTLQVLELNVPFSEEDHRALCSAVTNSGSITTLATYNQYGTKESYNKMFERKKAPFSMRMFAPESMPTELHNAPMASP
jgi:hypothetical protein